MKKHPVWFLVIGIAILVIPSAIYLVFLVPQLKEEYNVLMASGGIIGGAGFYASAYIPEKTKYGSLFKTASRSFTALAVITLVREFIMELIGLVAIFIVSFVVFKILVGVWKDARRKLQNKELADEIARSIDETSK